jgi:UDP-N-acetylmuramyl pentapeptide phosphotransferase/UDP-N-acetylglucosamine-1-phosphate transferase
VPAAIATALLVASCSLLLLRQHATALGLVDRPDARKCHPHPTPVVGGLAIFVGMVAGLAVSAVGAGKVARPEVVLVMMGLQFVAAGLLDDLMPLQARMRFLKQLLFVVWLPLVLPWSVQNLGDLVGLGLVQLGWLALPFTFIAMVALVNGTNMLDGMDGLAGSCSAIGLAGLAIVGWQTGLVAALPAVLCLLAGLVAFLACNLPLGFNGRLRLFMGDAGSNFLGFAMAFLALWLLEAGGHERIAPALIVWLLPLPVFEIFYTPVRRRLAGQAATAADRNHWHHRLLAAGWSAPQVVALYAGFSLASVLIGLLLNHHAPAWTQGCGFVLWFGLWLLLQRLLTRQKASCRPQVSDTLRNPRLVANGGPQ